MNIEIKENPLVELKTLSIKKESDNSDYNLVMSLLDRTISAQRHGHHLHLDPQQSHAGYELLIRSDAAQEWRKHCSVVFVSVGYARDTQGRLVTKARGVLYGAVNAHSHSMRVHNCVFTHYNEPDIPDVLEIEYYPDEHAEQIELEQGIYCTAIDLDSNKPIAILYGVHFENGCYHVNMAERN